MSTARTSWVDLIMSDQYAEALLLRSARSGIFSLTTINMASGSALFGLAPHPARVLYVMVGPRLELDDDLEKA